MAVLHLWQSKNDCGIDREPRSYDGLSGGRRRVRGKNPAALHREYRGHRPDLPGDVQERLLSRPFAFGVVGPHPPELVKAHLNIDQATLDTVPRYAWDIVPGYAKGA